MIRSILYLLAFSLALLFTSCNGNSSGNGNNAPNDVTGLVTVQSDNSVAVTVDSLQSALRTNENISIVATIDHSSNAQNAGLTLPPEQLILFGNPTLGTPLMQQNQTAGIDLPQKFLVYQNNDNEVITAYNDPQYVADRHGITGQDEIITKISDALANFTEKATGNPVDRQLVPNTVKEGEGLLSVESQNSVDETFQKLEAAIQNNDALTVMAKLDHQANAASVGMDLRPTRLLVFGNPDLGTPLMQDSQTIGIDLPQKVLVYEDANGKVFVVYNDPFYLAKRHGIENQDDRLNTISNALQNLAKVATSK